MLTISKRAKEAPASPIRKLIPFAEQAKKRGIKVFHLNIGQPDLPTPPEILKAIKSFKEKTLAYAPSAGISETIEAWQKFYSQKGIEFERDEIVITNGGSEAILFALEAVCDIGDNVIVFDPFYANYAGYASLSGVNLIPVILNVENGFHLENKKQIEEKINKKTKAIMICNPNNPTGTVYTPDEIKMIAEIVKKHDLFIISDETYQEIVFDNKKVANFYKFKDLLNQLIIVDSVSKRFNACGARIGCIASINKDVMTVSLKYGQARLSVATVEQLSVIPPLAHWKSYTNSIKKIYEKRRNVVVEELAKIPKVKFTKPGGAFYLVAKLPVKDTEEFAKFLLTDFYDKKETVMVAPAAGFYLTPGLGKQEIRIAYVLEEKSLKRTMQLLGLAIKKFNLKHSN